MKKHALGTRIWHWVNALSLIELFMSGLTISNAHPHLYWGQWGFMPGQQWTDVVEFPDWIIIPGYYDLAAARDWHVLFSAVFIVALLLFFVSALINGHLRRDFAFSRREWRWSAIRDDLRAHLRLDFEHHQGKFNFLQRVAYAAVLFVLLPLMLLTGLAISPGMDAAWPFLIDVFGGRQSARSIHFIVAWALAGFFVLHIVLVLLNKPLRNLRDMISGGRGDAAA
jgi:Ni/Fe-hydrogenase b-type cytochrome subunit